MKYNKITNGESKYINIKKEVNTTNNQHGWCLMGTGHSKICAIIPRCTNIVGIQCVSLHGDHVRNKISIYNKGGFIIYVYNTHKYQV